MSKVKPWHDVPSCKSCPDDSGPIVFVEGYGYRCAACGVDAPDLTDEDKARCRKAEEAWDRELERQGSEAQREAEHARKLPLLNEAVARRRAMMRGKSR